MVILSGTKAWVRARYEKSSRVHSLPSERKKRKPGRKKKARTEPLLKRVAHAASQEQLTELADMIERRYSAGKITGSYYEALVAAQKKKRKALREPLGPKKKKRKALRKPLGPKKNKRKALRKPLGLKKKNTRETNSTPGRQSVDQRPEISAAFTRLREHYNRITKIAEEQRWVETLKKLDELCADLKYVSEKRSSMSTSGVSNKDLELPGRLNHVLSKATSMQSKLAANIEFIDQELAIIGTRKRRGSNNHLKQNAISLCDGLKGMSSQIEFIKTFADVPLPRRIDLVK
jgi:hypothetical protein